jgi:short subunit dehydrogenase-like uncharacterized protein
MYMYTHRKDATKTMVKPTHVVLAHYGPYSLVGETLKHKKS